MSINVANLEVQLAGLIQPDSSAEDILLVSKYIDKLKTGSIFTVGSFSDLPADAAEGDLYFVESDRTLYVNTSLVWNPIVTDYVGLVWSWGSDKAGMLGTFTYNVSRSSPVSVVGGFTDWCQVSGNHKHSLGVRTNGTVWSWGDNGQGRLGDGTIVNKSSPVSVVGGFTDWCQASAGGYSTAAVRANGTLWTWGSGGQGQLGDGTTVAKSSPVSVLGGFTDWCQVSAGISHDAAVRTNGTLWAWGYNAQGQLGDGTAVNKSSPVSVVGGFTDWCQVSAGGCHAAAVRTNGTLWTWGRNSAGQLGDGTTVSKSSPVSVVGGFTDWCQVSAGDYHTVAIRTNGTLWAWGNNSAGQLGDGTSVSRLSPVSVVGGFTDWCFVGTSKRVNERTTAAIRQNGTLWSWGAGSYGRLGDGTTTQKSSPVSVVGGFTDWCMVATGYHGLGLRAKTF